MLLRTFFFKPKCLLKHYYFNELKKLLEGFFSYNISFKQFFRLCLSISSLLIVHFCFTASWTSRAMWTPCGSSRTNWRCWPLVAAGEAVGAEAVVVDVVEEAEDAGSGDEEGPPTEGTAEEEDETTAAILATSEWLFELIVIAHGCASLFHSLLTCISFLYVKTKRCY